jgi:hypothetical protein
VGVGLRGRLARLKSGGSSHNVAKDACSAAVEVEGEGEGGGEQRAESYDG